MIACMYVCVYVCMYVRHFYRAVLEYSGGVKIRWGAEETRSKWVILCM